MIDINLVPPELRKKRRTSLLSEGLNIPLEVIIGLGGGMIAILVMIHISLLFMGIQKLSHQGGLKKQWEALLPEKEKIDVVLNEMRQLQGDIKSMEEITQAKDASWARKLNVISDELPKSVWIKKIALGEKTFFIEGSSLARNNTEMTGVHKLTSSLRENQDFLKGLNELEITSIQSKVISGTDVVDFLITVKAQ